MNGHFAGDPEVAERVRASALALAYSPNFAARSLALGSTKAIAFVVPDLANPAFQAMLSGLSKTAAKDGYRVLVADSAEVPEDEPELAMEVRRRCDAIVLCAPRMPRAELESIAESLHPLVLVNRPDVNVDAPSLSIDYGAGILELAEHLRALGHTAFAYLEGPPESVSNAARVRSLDAFEREHSEVSIARIPCGVNVEDGVAATQDVVESKATAVLAFNDLVAVGLLRGLTDRGIRVPDDISIAGFDDIPYARYISPPLTTVSVPHSELGVQAWRRMEALLGSGTPEAGVVFTPRLVARASTAAPRL